MKDTAMSLYATAGMSASQSSPRPKELTVSQRLSGLIDGLGELNHHLDVVHSKLNGSQPQSHPVPGKTEESECIANCLEMIEARLRLAVASITQIDEAL